MWDPREKKHIQTTVDLEKLNIPSAFRSEFIDTTEPNRFWINQKRWFERTNDEIIFIEWWFALTWSCLKFGLL